HIKIYNLSGNLVSNIDNIQNVNFSLNTSQLNSGIYFIYIEDSSKRFYVNKFLKL
ncbi:MAG: T9SS type A sorting domain-containing protein, partial [Bacteroidia bacterium]|nr:T9SS type A sorting domain-containing protein [Bacteroidia bacterium]